MTLICYNNDILSPDGYDLKLELGHEYLFPQVSSLNQDETHPNERVELMASLSEYEIDGLQYLIESIDEEREICREQLQRINDEKQILDIVGDNTKWYIELAGAIKEIAKIKLKKLVKVSPILLFD